MADGASSFRELLPNCHTLLPDMDSCHTHSYIFSPGHCFRFFLSSLWTCSERIDRTLPKAQQTQESSACARVIAQTSQELVKVLHTMAKLWKAVAKSLSSCCKAVSCHSPVVSTPKSATATMSTNFVLASSTASVKSIKSQLKESVNYWLSGKSHKNFPYFFGPLPLLYIMFLHCSLYCLLETTWWREETWRHNLHWLETSDL